MVATDAVIHHREASAHGRRSDDIAPQPHRADREAAVHVLLAQASALAAPFVALRLLLGSLVRAAVYLLGKDVAAARDEVGAVLSLALHPSKVRASRALVARTTTEPASAVRHLRPTARAQLRQGLEAVTGVLTTSGSSSPGTSVSALDSGPVGEDADYLDGTSSGLLRRVLVSPAFLIGAALTIVAVIGTRGLWLGDGVLQGGALLPPPPGGGDLWETYRQAWHDVGPGSTTPAPPYLTVVAAVAFFLLGKAPAAVTFLLLLGIPAAGASAYVAMRGLIPGKAIRVWASAAYALLPAMTGAVASGRIGTTILAIALPFTIRSLVRIGGPNGTLRRSAGTAILVAIVLTVSPALWIVLVIAGVAAAVHLRPQRCRDGQGSARPPRCGPPCPARPAPAVVGLRAVPPHAPAARAGAERHRDHRSGPAAMARPPAAPGGPGHDSRLAHPGDRRRGAARPPARRPPPRDRRLRDPGRAGPGHGAAAVDGARHPAGRDGRDPSVAGPGDPPPRIGLHRMAAVAVEGLRARLAGSSFTLGQPLALVVAVVALLAPVLSSVWFGFAVDGVVRKAPASAVPAFVAADAESPQAPRTLVIADDSAGRVRYSLLNGAGPILGDAETGPPAAAWEALDPYVAAMVSGRGGDEIETLAGYGIRYVVLAPGASTELVPTLDGEPGLRRLSSADGEVLWRVAGVTSRARLVTEEKQTPLGVAAEGTTTADPYLDQTLPEGTGARTLVTGVALDGAWRAVSVAADGTQTDLAATAGPGLLSWSQAFEAPEGTPQVVVAFDDSARSRWLWLQLVVLLALVVMALPERRRLDPDPDLDDDTADVAAPAAGRAPDVAAPAAGRAPDVAAPAAGGGA